MSCYACVSLFVTILFVTNNIISSRLSTDCKFDAHNKDNEKFLPLLLHNNTSYFTFVIPQKGIVQLKNGEGITLACPDRKNYITATNSNSTYAICIRQNVMRIARTTVNFEDILCEKSIKGDTLKTNILCGDGRGKIVYIGYAVAKGKWVTLIEVCYDESTSSSLYSKHELLGEEIKYSSKSDSNPGFSTAGLEPNTAVSLAYKQTFQKSTFNKLLGTARTAEEYINKKSFLARGHLSPNADFIFAVFRRSTYYYLNASPQWQAVNGGNWKSVESVVRKSAQSYNSSFTIVTGIHMILSLKDSENNPQEIYLISGSKLPVPKYIWKIVYHKNTKRGVVFIILNNPFIKSVSEIDLLCPNICDEYGWSRNNNWSNVKRGFVHCCDLTDFFNVVITAPTFETDGILYR